MIVSRAIANVALAVAIVMFPAAAWAPTGQGPVAVLADAAHVELAAPDGRKIDLSVWEAAEERGVVIFSHGFNASPTAYHRILSQWVDHGFTVVAPLHIDSLSHPDQTNNGPTAFATRIADLAVARNYIKTTRPGRPLIAAGHSFGSLMSLIGGGAVTVAGPLGDPDVRAIVAFSSVGDVPGVIMPETYSALRAPALMITGDADLVPGYVSDWHAHRSPFDQGAPGDKMLLVVPGGDHSLVDNAEAADFELIVRLSITFMETYGLGDAAARGRLEALVAPDGVSLERR